MVSDFTQFDEEMEDIHAMMRYSGRRLLVSLAQTTAGHGYHKTLHAIEQANEQGLKMTGVVAARAID
ncbi:hypothetical protein [Mycobacterium sp. RTGN4]|uniref:hypothetical protein n=1 Tax=Mycobacterium sp. RTGN4 TaxID=3016523 RepID=UPI0029C7BC33|nr:hypothetical protein [Mycobacterium sp. RTGN4]